MSCVSYAAQASTQLTKLADQDDQWWLPHYLREASGIAVVGPRSILVHDDEIAVIYHIALETHEIEVLGWLGSKEFTQDFEGIAVHDETLYLVTSTGMIYRAPARLDRRQQTLEFTVLDTGLESVCETEGLHYMDGKLLILCKVPRVEKYQDTLAIFQFDLATYKTNEHLVLPLESFPGIDVLMPTALEVSGQQLFVMSTNHLFAIDLETLKPKICNLPKIRHYQPEGIGVLDDGTFVIVDDYRKGESRLTEYPDMGSMESCR